MLDQIPLEQLIVWLLGAEQTDVQGLERGQVGDEGFGDEGIEKIGAKPWNPSSGLAPTVRQANEFSPVKLEQERPGGHVLELPSRIAPIPLFGQGLGNPSSTPLRMSVDQPSDLGDVLVANRASLNRLCFKHAERLRELVCGVQHQDEEFLLTGHGHLLHLT